MAGIRSDQPADERDPPQRLLAVAVEEQSADNGLNRIGEWGSWQLAGAEQGLRDGGATRDVKRPSS